MSDLTRPTSPYLQVIGTVPPPPKVDYVRTYQVRCTAFIRALRPGTTTQVVYTPGEALPLEIADLLERHPEKVPDASNFINLTDVT